MYGAKEVCKALVTRVRDRPREKAWVGREVGTLREAGSWNPTMLRTNILKAADRQEQLIAYSRPKNSAAQESRRGSIEETWRLVLAKGPKKIT